mmetsp:Transcript_41479/g.125656  ORF Transcript_41479/g.125656 Transcript_41479/m.125656 type:complete len:90 (+) Transcript_41479:1241-1510(+)
MKGGAFNFIIGIPKKFHREKLMHGGWGGWVVGGDGASSLDKWRSEVQCLLCGYHPRFGGWGGWWRWWIFISEVEWSGSMIDVRLSSNVR